MSRFSKAGVTAALAGAMMVLGATPALAGDEVRVRDACDPVTFDLNIHPGACVPVDDSGSQVTFDELFEALREEGRHDAWRFTEEVGIDEGDELVVEFNRGGEAHTFSEVAAFGPGCIAEVNKALGFEGMFAPECGSSPPPSSDFPGLGFLERIGGPAGPGPEQIGPAQRELRVAGLSAGTHMFMCLIHPWMQTTVEVGED